MRNTIFAARGLAARLVLALALLGAVSAQASQRVEVTAGVGSPVMLAGNKQLAYLKVRLRGFEIDDAQRAPVNVALVLDKSGSMSGEKLQRAKDAAIMVLDRLQADDIVSIVVYDTTVSVLVPATKLTDRADIYTRIRAINAGGNTALFAGVSKGAAEVGKFLEKERVNRIVLLSDGLANEGPSAPEDLGDLGASLYRTGISVTTIGLGLDYNEDLLASLAKRSNGSHLFAAEADDLMAKFDLEFGDVLTAVAQNATIVFDCAEEIRPVRILGRDGTIEGNKITVPMGQVFGRQDKYVIVEVEVPSHGVGDEIKVASVKTTCENLLSNQQEVEHRELRVRFSLSQEEVDRNADASVMVSVVRQIAAERNAAARILRDQGNIEEARRTFADNAAYLYSNGILYNADRLIQDSLSNKQDSENLDEDQWQEQRKSMLESQLQQQLQALGYTE